MQSDVFACTFNDVLIVPKYSEITSRRDVDISVDFGMFKLYHPSISANMKHITEHRMAQGMIDEGGMGIIHRFCTVEREVEEYRKVQAYIDSPGDTVTANSVLFSENINAPEGTSATTYTTNSGQTVSVTNKKNHNGVVGVSIGVQEEDVDRFIALYDAGARIFCIDIAHGHCKQMKDMLEKIKLNRKDVYIIAGNVATADGAYDLADWGANCVKVGIGPGSACMTRKNTGIGVPQLYALESVQKEFVNQGIKNVKIIADGGMTSPGDITKALKYADAVMLGNMLSGTTETPGAVFEDENGRFYKVYAGSASGENKVQNGSVNEYVEGIAKTTTFRGHVKHILRKIKHGIQSAFSYVGASNMVEFKRKCEFIEITSGGRDESKI